MWTITAQHKGNRALNISAQHGFLCAFKWGYFSNLAFGWYESIFEYITCTLIVLLRDFLQQNWLKSHKQIRSYGWRQDFTSVLWTGFTPQGIWVSVSPAKTQIRQERNLDISNIYLWSVTLGPLHFYRHWYWHCTKLSILNVLCHKNLKLHKSLVRST